ncbi:MAG: phosphatidylserine decarboxylase family protein [Verrucomicrobia bacterium]|nr:phosphatidylserine decarboxylase family protein [Verrucomicrobiota bacterium]
MKHRGKAAKAGSRMILASVLVFLLAAGALNYVLKGGGVLLGLLAGLWVFFVVFVINFFRDPEAVVPSDPKAIVSPAHGTVDVIDETEEPVFLGGRCRRISIFLSVVDVHVQQAPVAGKVSLVRHTPGQYLNALKAESALHNENVLVGIESSEAAGEKVALRLIAGLIARRILPWVRPGDATGRGERISLIQFGSRVDLYLPLACRVTAVLGQKVRGGETIVAERA